MWPWFITGEYKKSSIFWMLSFSFCNGSQASILLTANLSTWRHLTNQNMIPESGIMERRHPDVRLNSIPWCTSFHVILSLRTWHIMITTLQHARNEHRSARCVWFSNMFRFSSLCFWEYNCIELADIHCALKKNFSVTLKGYICLTDLSRTTCALGRNYKHKVWDSATDKVHWENRNHDWSQKWLQQNSRYAVKLITKGGFITASRSQALGLQRQLQIKFNLSMRQTILWSTIYPVLTQAIFKEISWPEYWSVLLNK